MSALKPAFKAFDIHALINKINKSIVAPLPTKYSSQFRGLVKSMLRKNPELRPSAAELLGNQYLQPYVLRVHLKLNSPRRSSLRVQRPQSHYMQRTRFSEPEVLSSNYREKRHSFSNDRTLNPSISGGEQDSLCSTQEIHDIHNLNRRFTELSDGDSHKEAAAFKQSVVSKTTNIAKVSRLTLSKASATPKKWSEPLKNRASVPGSRIPKKSISTTRRASLPFQTGGLATQKFPYRPNVGILHYVESPDVSVNSPRIDRIAEFPLASYDYGDRSITKDKCTIQTSDRASEKPRFADAWQGIQRSIFKVDREDGTDECSDQNATAGASSRTSSDSRRRFDPSSYQQRAEALEGLLEFSARLLQQERYDELGVLLKPFGPGKVSPRETAIWLTKSIKQNTLQQED